MRIRIIDAFTDRPFAGNPAAVCLLNAGAWPDEDWMRQVAAEMNLSETAFAHPLPEKIDADWALRWFTPTVEIDLCGHATLATAHALSSDRGTPGTIRFSSRSGVLTTHTHDDGTITLDFPAAPLTEVPIPDDLAETLSAKPDATYGTGALGDLLAVFPDEASARALAPDFTTLAGLTRRDGTRGIIAAAPAAGRASGYDFVSRSPAHCQVNIRPSQAASPRAAATPRAQPEAASVSGYRRRVHTEELRIQTGSREQVRDLTAECRTFLSRAGVRDGLLHVWVPHATAGLAVIETGSGSDTDLLAVLHELLPADGRWSHRHGSPGHGRDHLLPALLPPYASIPVLGGRLALGTWQSICLVDTNGDNPVRTVRLSFLSG